MKSRNLFHVRDVRRRTTCTPQAGLTLVELMVSLTLGLLVVMAASALLLSTKSGYVAQDEDAQVQDAGRYSLEIVARAVRQAAFENWDATEAPIVVSPGISANIIGLDARSLKTATPGIESPYTAAVNGSDVLAVRFYGAGEGAGGDGTMLNCAGFGIAAPASRSLADMARGWSIFYVAESSSGEPELYCKYRGNSAWTAQAIARGVESFQVLYGVDTDADGLANRLMTATEIQALDDALPLEGATETEKQIDRNRKTNWKRVVVIKIALLLRGSQSARADRMDREYDLFGKDYADANASNDVGTRIKEDHVPKNVRNRIRRVFAATIQLRNQSAGSAT